MGVEGSLVEIREYKMLEDIMHETGYFNDTERPKVVYRNYGKLPITHRQIELC